VALGFGKESGIVTKEIKIVPDFLGPLVHCDRLIAIGDAGWSRSRIRPDLSKGQRFRCNRVRAPTLFEGNMSIHIQGLYKQIEVNTSMRMLEKGLQNGKKAPNFIEESSLNKTFRQKESSGLFKWKTN